MYIDKYQRVTQVRTQLVANNNKQKEKVSSIEKTNIQNLNCETHKNLKHTQLLTFIRPEIFQFMVFLQLYFLRCCCSFLFFYIY